MEHVKLHWFPMLFLLEKAYTYFFIHYLSVTMHLKYGNTQNLCVVLIQNRQNERKIYQQMHKKLFTTTEKEIFFQICV